VEAVAARMNVHRPLAEEDSARADFYALLARLLHGAPDERLLRTIAIAAPMHAGDADLTAAWNALVAAAGVFDPEAAAGEYEALFVGVGPAAVSVYAGRYAGAGAAVPARVGIIEDLAAMGLSHHASAPEPEDHFAGLFETMRILVAGGAGRAPAALEEQKRFFETHVKPGVFRFLGAVRAAPQANFYRKVAALGAAFAAIESESFSLD
jgi:TorA maturation chaperone TorD